MRLAEAAASRRAVLVGRAGLVGVEAPNCGLQADAVASALMQQQALAVTVAMEHSVEGQGPLAQRAKLVLLIQAAVAVAAKSAVMQVEAAAPANTSSSSSRARPRPTLTRSAQPVRLVQPAAKPAVLVGLV